MHISSNELPSQNQLVIGGVTHKLIYMLKSFDFINVGQYSLSYSNRGSVRGNYNGAMTSETYIDGS